MSTLLTTPAGVAWAQVGLLESSTRGAGDGIRRLAARLSRRKQHRRMPVDPTFSACTAGPAQALALHPANDNGR